VIIEPTGVDVLAVPLQPNGSGEDTIGGYLVALLREVWNHGSDFSGKRPFGNSGWHYDLYTGLIEAGMIAGRFDSDGHIETCDGAAGTRLINKAIDALADMQ
jgi:hypothetical protein